MTTMMKKTLTCPNCRTVFTVDVITSTNNLGGQTTDLRPVAAGMQPVADAIHTCPGCGLSGYGDAFNGKITAEVGSLIAERLTPLVRDEHVASPRRCEFAAWIAEWRGEADYVIGQYYLRAAWCCDAGEGLNRDDEEDFYRRQAVVYFERALERGQLDADAVAVCTYLIGENLRRIGEQAAAAGWYDKVIALARTDDRQSPIAELAAAQKTAPRDRI